MSAPRDMWEDDRVVPDAPPWAADITFTQVCGVRAGGCAGGSYMPAIEYYTAAATMAAHGYEIIDAIRDAYGDDATRPPTEVCDCWGRICSWYVTRAVELWAAEVVDRYEDGAYDAIESDPCGSDAGSDGREPDPEEDQ